MARPTRVGVIGAGVWAVQNHIPLLARRPDVELVGVCRHGEDQLATIQKEFGFAVASTDYRDIVALDLDAIVVSSPAAFHHEHATAALRSGAHVLVEKPFTTTALDAWDLVDTAREEERHIVVSFGYNWHAMVTAARQLIAEGGIGELRAVFVRMASDVGDLLTNGRYPTRVALPDLPSEFATWSDPLVAGGGYAPGQLSHALGIAMSIADVRAEEVFAYTNGHAPGIDLYDAISVKYQGGAIGTVSGSVCPEGWGRDQLEVRLYGAGGQIILDLERPMLSQYRGPGDEIRIPFPSDAGKYACDGPPNALIDLARGISVENPASGELGARTVEPVEAALRSAQLGKPVAVAS